MPPVPLSPTILHVVRNEEPPPGAGPHWTPPAMDLQLSGAAAERFVAHAREMARTSILSLGESMVKLVQHRGTGPARPLATERRRRR